MKPGLVLRLDHRPPLDWDTMSAFLGARALPGLERVGDGAYHRLIGDDTVVVRPDPTGAALRVTIPPRLAGRATDIAARVRRLFDLDAHPDRVAERFADDQVLGPCVVRRPGLRVPGAFEPFEAAVRAVLGQQVSVRAATTLAGRLVARFGPPTADVLAAAPPEALRALGLTGARALTLGTLGRAVHEGRVTLDGADPERTIAALEALPGIGPWTASYIAMRALGWPDAFPAADLGIKKALGLSSAREVERRAEAWRPWRAYAVMHLWHR